MQRTGGGALDSGTIRNRRVTVSRWAAELIFPDVRKTLVHVGRSRATWTKCPGSDRHAGPTSRVVEAKQISSHTGGWNPRNGQDANAQSAVHVWPLRRNVIAVLDWLRCETEMLDLAANSAGAPLCSTLRSVELTTGGTEVQRGRMCASKTSLISHVVRQNNGREGKQQGFPDQRSGTSRPRTIVPHAHDQATTRSTLDLPR